MSIPPEFECPITLTIMTDPVIGDDNQTYERSAIEHWISDPRNQMRSPITRAPMRIDTLRTNYALKSQIERFISQTTLNISSTTPLTPPPFISSPLTLSASWVKTEKENLLNISVTPLSDGDRQPAVVFIILDNSGSMGSDCGADVEEGANAFTILDLCKHTVRTIGGILGAKDMLCLITYSSTAKVVMKPTFMTAEGKTKLDLLIKNVMPEGNTNIWAGLELMDRIASSPEFSNSNISAALLTDGVSNMNPGRGVFETFKLYAKPSLYNLSTFGFGYNIDSKLLVEISSFSGGAYAFCPDFTMVATVFINWVSTTLSSAARPQKIKVHFQDGSIVSLNTGTIQLGQPRSFTLPFTSEVTSVTMADLSSVPTRVDTISLREMARFDLISSIKSALITTDNSVFADVCSKYKSPDLVDLLSEINPTGQVYMGMDNSSNSRKPSFYSRWGQHYVPAYLRAQELQQRMNFKDAGLQSYGGSLFETIQTAGDYVFSTITPLDSTGSKKSTAYDTYRASTRPSFSTPVNMTSMNTPYGGCWAPGSLIKMADNSMKLIEDVRRGDQVWTITGPATVEYALQLGTYQASQPMVKLGELWITPWHPVLDRMIWTLPEKLGPISDRKVSTVYNLILDHGHIVNVSGVLTVTLGHGFGGSVIQHDYFGNKQSILEDLQFQPGYTEGRPVYSNLLARKQDNKVVGWYDAI